MGWGLYLNGLYIEISDEERVDLGLLPGDVIKVDAEVTLANVGMGVARGLKSLPSVGQTTLNVLGTPRARKSLGMPRKPRNRGPKSLM